MSSATRWHTILWHMCVISYTIHMFSLLMVALQENCWFFCTICLKYLEWSFHGVFSSGDLSHPGLDPAPQLQVSIEAQIFTLEPEVSTTISEHWPVSLTLWYELDRAHNHAKARSSGVDARAYSQWAKSNKVNWGKYCCSTCSAAYSMLGAIKATSKLSLVFLCSPPPPSARVASGSSSSYCCSTPS